jgi:hypothetical protein
MEISRCYPTKLELLTNATVDDDITGQQKKPDTITDTNKPESRFQ